MTGEVVDVVLVPAERLAHPVREAHGTAEPHVDASGEERLQHAELLSHDKRLVVGQHHAAGPHADAAGGRRDGRGQDGGCGTGDTGHAVVLRDPEPVVPEPLDLLRQPHGVP